MKTAHAATVIALVLAALLPNIAEFRRASADDPGIAQAAAIGYVLLAVLVFVALSGDA